MDAIDRAFLNDYVQFGYMNHVAASIALARCLVSPSTLAAELRWRVEDVPLPQAQTIAKELNDTPRMQKIMLAKLIVEYLGAMESFGAFCDAIRHRQAKGIYARFVNSGEEVRRFFEYVLAHSNEDLGQLLQLPTLTELKGSLPDEMLGEIGSSYQHYRDSAQSIAQTYRKIEYTPFDDISPEGLPGGWESELNILLGAPGGQAKINSDRRGLFTIAANKIKHRFTVVEHLDWFARPHSADHAIPYARLSMELDWIETLYNNILIAAMSTADIAALLILLDQQGVTL